MRHAERDLQDGRRRSGVHVSFWGRRAAANDSLGCQPEGRHQKDAKVAKQRQPDRPESVAVGHAVHAEFRHENKPKMSALP